MPKSQESRLAEPPSDSRQPLGPHRSDTQWDQRTYPRSMLAARRHFYVCRPLSVNPYLGSRIDDDVPIERRTWIATPVPPPTSIGPSPCKISGGSMEIPSGRFLLPAVPPTRASLLTSPRAAPRRAGGTSSWRPTSRDPSACPRPGVLLKKRRGRPRLGRLPCSRQCNRTMGPRTRQGLVPCMALADRPEPYHQPPRRPQAADRQLRDGRIRDGRAPGGPARGPRRFRPTRPGISPADLRQCGPACTRAVRQETTWLAFRRTAVEGRESRHGRRGAGPGRSGPCTSLVTG